jgi:hypothetical protein
LGVATPLVALLTLVLVPLTTHAGEWLRDRVPDTPLVRRHAEMGDGLLPWVAGLFLVSALSWYLRHRKERNLTETAAAPGAAPPMMPPTTGTARQPSASARPTTADRRTGLVTAAIGVLAVVVSAGAVVQVVRIGDTGARAAWQGNFSPTPRPHP